MKIMKAFNKEEVNYLKSILENADDQTLFELFGNSWETVKAIIRKQSGKKPYEFHNRFGDLN
jgi:hypothetical protein